MKKTIFILGLLTLPIAVLAQSTNAITVNDLPSAVSAVGHYLGFNISPAMTLFLIHWFAKYYRNTALANKFSHEVNVFEKLISVVAASPLPKLLAVIPQEEPAPAPQGK